MAYTTQCRNPAVCGVQSHNVGSAAESKCKSLSVRSTEGVDSTLPGGMSGKSLATAPVVQKRAGRPSYTESETLPDNWRQASYYDITKWVQDDAYGRSTESLEERRAKAAMGDGSAASQEPFLDDIRAHHESRASFGGIDQMGLEEYPDDEYMDY